MTPRLALGLLLLGGCPHPSSEPPVDDWTVAVDPPYPVTGQALSARVDGTNKDVSLAWELDGVATTSGPHVDGGLVARGDVWTLVATLGDEVQRASVTVANAPPVGALLRVSPDAPHPYEHPLRCEVVQQPTDADADPVAAELTWLLDGVDAGPGDQPIPALDLEDGQAWTCRGRFADGDGGVEEVAETVTVSGRTTLAFVALPAGTFVMGVPEDEFARSTNASEIAVNEPLPRTVTLTHDFELSAYEVTHEANLLYSGFDALPDEAPCATCPAIGVSRHRAAAFTNLLSDFAGLPRCYTCEGEGWDTVCAHEDVSPYDCEGYRLPTEAEWEYAARSAGTTSGAFANGQDATGPHGESYEVCDDIVLTDGSRLSAQAWTCATSGDAPQPVGSLHPNAAGLFDMSGNVVEWTHDAWLGTGVVDADIDPWGATTGTNFGLRGGSYDRNSANARVGYRRFSGPTTGMRIYGFRVARTLPTTSSPDAE